MLHDAFRYNKRAEVDSLKNVFDRCVLNFPLLITDQCPCGIASIMLYKHFQELKYKNYADKMFHWLKEQSSNYGILYRQNSNCQVVDVIGMVPPFLYYYASTFKCDSAQHLADLTIEKFITYGTDTETGMPCFSFRTNEPHIKMGMANWGRGTSWYAIGLLYNDPENLSFRSQKCVERFNKNIKELYKSNGHFSQFIGESGIDLSAELPLLYYMHKKHIHEIKTNDIMQYSKYMHDGVLYNSSSSNNGIIRYGVNLGSNCLSQAFMINLLNEAQ